MVEVSMGNNTLKNSVNLGHIGLNLFFNYLLFTWIIIPAEVIKLRIVP